MDVNQKNWSLWFRLNTLMLQLVAFQELDHKHAPLSIRVIYEVICKSGEGCFTCNTANQLSFSHLDDTHQCGIIIQVLESRVNKKDKFGLRTFEQHQKKYWGGLWKWRVHVTCNIPLWISHEVTPNSDQPIQPDDQIHPALLLVVRWESQIWDDALSPDINHPYEIIWTQVLLLTFCFFFGFWNHCKGWTTKAKSAFLSAASCGAPVVVRWYG